MKPAAIVFCLLTSCTITIQPLATKTVVVKSIREKHGADKPVPTKVQLVDANWIANYKTLEAEHGDFRIPQDDQITPIDSKFRVPPAVMDHYHDLLNAR